MTKLEQLRALLKAATPRPWVLDGKDGAWVAVTSFQDGEPRHWISGPSCGDKDLVHETGSLIVAAVNALPALLDMAEAAQRIVININPETKVNEGVYRHLDNGDVSIAFDDWERIGSAIAKLEAPT